MNNMKDLGIKTIGSLCSGIEAGTVALKNMGYEFQWYSEIADFPSRILKERFPDTPNLGDMTLVPELILSKKITSPDLICGGTPCQAFSLTGFRSGLYDERGNLTLKFVDVIEANDKIRQQNGQNQTIVFWENVEGVLTDKTNAFGCLISYLAGLDNPIEVTKWPKAGILRGPIRNVAWRVIDAKYFGVPQQRKRLYLLAGGKDFSPEKVLFEKHEKNRDVISTYPDYDMEFDKENHHFEIFRGYTDCLYAAYGTKWNGNAAANNGSLFVVQDGKIRRLSPLECERLMGFPDNYTKIPGARRTQRYTAIGNSWAIPVIKWIGSRLNLGFSDSIDFNVTTSGELFDLGYELHLFKEDIIPTNAESINCSYVPENPRFGSLKDIITSEDVEDKLYITPTACYGIIRRGKGRVLPRLKEILESISSQLSIEEIEQRSRRQPRGSESGMAKLTKIVHEEISLNESPLTVKRPSLPKSAESLK